MDTIPNVYIESLKNNGGNRDTRSYKQTTLYMTVWWFYIIVTLCVIQITDYTK